MRDSKRRKYGSGRSMRNDSLFGRLMLEAVAVAGFLLLLTVSQSSSSSDNAAVEAVADRTADYGTLVAGFLSDQLDRNGVFETR